MIARLADNAPAKRSSEDCMLGSKSSAESSRRGINSQSRESESIFLNRVALVLKQHHYHGDAQQHLRNGAEHVADAAKHFRHGIVRLERTLQDCPQRQRNRQQSEMHSTRDGERAGKKRRNNTATPRHENHFEAQRAAEREGFKVIAQVQAGGGKSSKAKSAVIPAQRKGARVRRVETKMHIAMATENNELRKKRVGGWVVITERIERVVNGVAGPGDLPGAEVSLAALLVQGR